MIDSGMRSIAPLFVPGNRPDRFANAAASCADAVIIDLEDAVSPDAKAAARVALHVDFTTKPVFLRINAAGTVWHVDDVMAANAWPIAGILLPKAEASINLGQVAGRHNLIALVETARGIADARALAAHPRVARLAFGSIDYCADIGCAHSRDAMLAARSELVLASRLADIPAPLDGVTVAFRDGAATEDDARYAATLGFGGKLCIHPDQVPAVFHGMRPSEDEIAWAEQVSRTGDGVGVISDTMIDAPVRLRARLILDRSIRTANR